METAKIFENGRSQAVRLPKKFRFDAEEVIVQQLGKAVLLVPKEYLWETFLDGLEEFTDDIFEEGRNPTEQRGSNRAAGYADRRTCQSGKHGACDE